MQELWLKSMGVAIFVTLQSFGLMKLVGHISRPNARVLPAWVWTTLRYYQALFIFLLLIVGEWIGRTTDAKSGITAAQAILALVLPLVVLSVASRRLMVATVKARQANSWQEGLQEHLVLLGTGVIYGGALCLTALRHGYLGRNGFLVGEIVLLTGLAITFGARRLFSRARAGSLIELEESPLRDEILEIAASLKRKPRRILVQSVRSAENAREVTRSEIMARVMACRPHMFKRDMRLPVELLQSVSPQAVTALLSFWMAGGRRGSRGAKAYGRAWLAWSRQGELPDRSCAAFVAALLETDSFLYSTEDLDRLYALVRQNPGLRTWAEKASGHPLEEVLAEARQLHDRAFHSSDSAQ